MKIFIYGSIALSLATAPLAAQAGQTTAQKPFATRGELTDLLDVLNGTVNSAVYTDTLKGIARAAAGVVRSRLDQGDFQVGDRIHVTVETTGIVEDTLVVLEDLKLELPAMGEFSVRGILRAELEEALGTFYADFVRNAVVRVSPLIRISIIGGVGRPGFYTVPSNTLLSDVVMDAGGPIVGSRLNEAHIDRNTEVLARADAVRLAFIEGNTLDQIGMREGDQLVIPERGDGGQGLQTSLRNFTTILGIPASIFALSRLF